MNDARQRGVGADAGGQHLQEAAARDGAGRDMVAPDFSTGMDSPVIDALVERAPVPAITSPSTGTLAPF